MAKTTPTPRGRFSRVIVRLVLGVVALEIVYVALANVALFAASTRFADRAPVGVAYDRALTFVPGRVHVRNLRVTGAANGGWNVTVADCDVVFDVWQIVNAPRRVRRISGDVTAVEIGPKGATKRLSGTIHVDVRDLAIDGSQISFDATSTVAGGAIDSAKETLASDVAGSVAIRIQDADDAGTGSVDLHGKFLSMAPLTSFASLIATQDPGTVRIVGSVKAGVLQPSSEVVANTAHATLKDARGASADYPHGLTITLGVSPTSPRALRLAVATPQIVFGSADPSRPADVFDGFELAVPAGDADLRLNRMEMRSLEWSTDHARIHEGATTLSGKASGTLRFEVGHASRLVANTGTIQVKDMLVEGDGDRAPFDALFSLERLEVSRDAGMAIRGHVHPSGKDAHAIVDLIVSSPPLRQTLAALDGQPFSGDAAFERRENHLAIDALTLDCAGLNLRGGYHRSASESLGAFVVTEGELRVGIVSKNGKESIVFAPASTWLETQLHAARP
jgi:hypothetical protein